jgi:post-segregation antitoxin (ccd killing protein)
MPSSVTVDDELWRKIKRLAAELDTTQGDIITRAIESFEKVHGIETYSPDPIARKAIQAAAERRKSIPWRIEIREALAKPGPSIDSLRISRLGDLVENKP